jgi:integrase
VDAEHREGLTSMGRRPTRNLNLPPGMRARPRGKKVFYYFDLGGKPRRELPLGSDYPAALKKWADLEADGSGPTKLPTFADAVARYRREVIPKKAPRTQDDNLAEMENLMRFFNNPPAELDAIQPKHIQQYLESRGGAPVRANREKALFSHIWNKARAWGYTSLPNPCQGVQGFSEKGRDVYIEDDVYAALYEAASGPVRDAMDLAYLTGQRPADTLRMQETDIRDGYLMVRQAKTGERMRIAVTGQLAKVIERILETKKKHEVRSLNLICNERGRALTAYALDGRWDHVRARAISLHPALADEIRRAQFRDLRAKAGTDKADSSGDIRKAQAQLGHRSVTMTETYVRKRRGAKVDPTR